MIQKKHDLPYRAVHYRRSAGKGRQKLWRTKMIPMILLQSQAEESADAPFEVMYGEVFLVADVGIVEYH